MTFYHLRQEFNFIVLDLVIKRYVFLMTTAIALQNVRKVYQAKISLTD